MRRLGLFCLASVCLSRAWAGDNAREAAAKGIALVQASQKAWTQSCDSCHHQALPMLAFRAAREHGIPVNENLARASAAGIFRTLADVDGAVQFHHVIDPALDNGTQLMAADAAGVRPSLTTAIYARLIAARQKPEGYWETLDVRPPQSYSRVPATAVAARALQLYGHPSLAADTKARLERARNWLAAVQIHSMEERIMQLRGIAWTGGDPALVARLAQALKSAQQPDGGWNGMEGRASDVFSTGEAMVALAEINPRETADPAWKRAIQFLLKSQAADGSWHVVSRIQPPAPVSPQYFETGYPYGHDQFVSIMGAELAIRALALSLPAISAPKPSAPEAAPATESWMETAIFGSAAELKALLDKGLDPNSATRSGGTTLLMAVQPNLEKSRLLIAKGAKVDARAKTRYSALMVAAQYPESGPTMRYLLDHGASAQPSKSAGTPLFNASPMVLAALAGNAEMLPRLQKAGGDIESRMLMVGSFPVRPLAGATFFGDVAGVRAALDSGAKVDQPDDDGITALGWAANGNRVAVAKLLIDHGADVNHVDRFGMTPLLYAASIDFGDGSMAELLLKSGADRNAHTKAGLTAGALARKYGHTPLIPVLP